MNQILMTGNKNGKNNNSTMDIKKVILFFSVAIIIFGAILIVNGVVGLNKNKNNNPKYNNSNNPNANIVEPNQTASPIPTEEVPGEDTEPPKIELLLSGETIKIVATDETQIHYIEYRWNNEEAETIVADEENQKEIQALVNIYQGTNTLEVTAVDTSGNVETKTQSFHGKIRPTVELFVNEAGDGVIIRATCEDGISKIEYTVNGEWSKLPFSEYDFTKEQWATVGAILEYSEDGKIIKAEYTHKFTAEQNEFQVYVYSLEGLVGEFERTYLRHEKK